VIGYYEVIGHNYHDLLQHGFPPILYLIEIIGVMNIIDNEILYNIYRLTNGKEK
jgi:hypothetical protein